MREALIGFAGVLVGAFATGGIEYAFQRRREKTTLRAASRLLQQQLYGVWEATYIHPRERFHADAEPHDFAEVTDTWRDTRDVLAEGLPGGAWEAVINAMEFVRVFDDTAPGQVPARNSKHRNADEEESFQRALVDLLHQRLEKATVVLERTAFGWRRARRVKKELAAAALEEAATEIEA